MEKTKRNTPKACCLCHILKLKCTKFDFGWGSAPPDLLAGFQGAYFEEEEGEGKERRKSRE